MSLMQMNAESLSRDLGESVEDVMVLIGKHEVQGFDSQTISELLGVTRAEIEAVQDDLLYRNMLLLMKVENSSSRLRSDNTIDAIEEVALQRLFDRVALERDAEFLLKVAATMNRMTRRTKPTNVLDPSQVGVRVPLTLTRRSIDRIHSDGTASRETEETMRINDGRMVNPTFGDVDQLLSVSQRPFVEKSIEVKMVSPREPDLDEMMDEVMQKDSWG